MNEKIKSEFPELDEAMSKGLSREQMNKLEQTSREMMEQSGKELDEAMMLAGATKNMSFHDEVVYEIDAARITRAIEAYQAQVQEGTEFEGGEPSKSDPYKRAAMAFYGIEYEAVTTVQRNAMKTILFAHIYGTPASEMAKHLGAANLDELKKGWPADTLMIEGANPKSSGAMMFNDQTKTGRMRSDQPNEANGPKLQNIPLRTEEAKELRKAFNSPIALEADYSELERRILSEIGKSEDMHSAAVVEAFRNDAAYGHSNLPPNAGILEGYGHVISGGNESMMGEPVGMVTRLTRRQEVVVALKSLSKTRLDHIVHYKYVPKDGGRKARRRAQMMRKHAVASLPEGVGLEEALAVINEPG